MKTAVILFFFFVCLSIGGWAFLRTLHQPMHSELSEKMKRDTFTKVLGRELKLNEPLQNNSVTSYSGEYFTLQYPTTAQVYTPSTSSPALKEAFSFTLPLPHLLVSVQVKDAPDSQVLSDASDVTLRLHSDVYQKTTPPNTPYESISFLKIKNGVEESFFAVFQKHEYSLVVSGSSQEKVHTLFLELLRSFTLL